MKSPTRYLAALFVLALVPAAAFADVPLSDPPRCQPNRPAPDAVDPEGAGACAEQLPPPPRDIDAMSYRWREFDLIRDSYWVGELEVAFDIHRVFDDRFVDNAMTLMEITFHGGDAAGTAQLPGSREVTPLYDILRVFITQDGDHRTATVEQRVAKADWSVIDGIGGEPTLTVASYTIDLPAITPERPGFRYRILQYGSTLWAWLGDPRVEFVPMTFTLSSRDAQPARVRRGMVADEVGNGTYVVIDWLAPNFHNAGVPPQGAATH